MPALEKGDYEAGKELSKTHDRLSSFDSKAILDFGGLIRNLRRHLCGAMLVIECCVHLEAAFEVNHAYLVSQFRREDVERVIVKNSDGHDGDGNVDLNIDETQHLTHRIGIGILLLKGSKVELFFC